MTPEDRKWWDTTAWHYVKCPRCKREEQQFCVNFPRLYQRIPSVFLERLGTVHDERITAALLLTGGTKEGAYKKFYCSGEA